VQAFVDKYLVASRGINVSILLTTILGFHNSSASLFHTEASPGSYNYYLFLATPVLNPTSDREGKDQTRHHG